ncbi:MAG: hypothetical protein D6742_13085 [Cyanobacteria bacterium J069]|nr:MAG: hypothetical protein D6742_13085 [Cyanobacteria bacterium J069]
MKSWRFFDARVGIVKIQKFLKAILLRPGLGKIGLRSGTELFLGTTEGDRIGCLMFSMIIKPKRATKLRRNQIKN